MYFRLRLLFLIVVPSNRKVGLYQGWLSRRLGSRISFFFLEPGLDTVTSLLFPV